MKIRASIHYSQFGKIGEKHIAEESTSFDSDDVEKIIKKLIAFREIINEGVVSFTNSSICFENVNNSSNCILIMYRTFDDFNKRVLSIWYYIDKNRNYKTFSLFPYRGWDEVAKEVSTFFKNND